MAVEMRPTDCAMINGRAVVYLTRADYARLWMLFHPNQHNAEMAEAGSINFVMLGVTWVCGSS